MGLIVTHYADNNLINLKFSVIARYLHGTCMVLARFLYKSVANLRRKVTDLSSFLCNKHDIFVNLKIRYRYFKGRI